MEQHHHFQASGLVQPPQTTPTTTDSHPSSISYSVPTHPHVNSNHPSYTEMITAAILWDSSQGKAGGSSKRAIAKYIDRVYTNLPPTHSALLTHHLKRLKNTGQLVMIKNSYQLPIVAAAATTTATNTTATTTTNSPIPLRSVQVPPQPDDPTPKKRPGRPPKPTPLPQPNSTISSSPVNGSSTGKRPRGRPPRNQTQRQVVSEVPFVQPVSVPQAQPNYTSDLGFNNGNFQSQSPQSVKRRPGRPSKKEAHQVLVNPVSQTEFQPIDEGSRAVVPANGSVQKRRGRPPRATNAVLPSGGVSGGPKSGGRGRPRKNALGLISKPIGKKTRGRRPRQAGVSPVVGGKRRGRPPKGSASAGPTKVKTVRKYTGSGKPRGRPKKSASTTAQGVADEELIKKVENMQVKVRDAVGILKPYFTNGNATSEAIAALQQLEDITTMDITSPPSSKLPPKAVNLFGDDTTIDPGLEDNITAPVSTFPEPQADPEPSVMPYSIADAVITESAPFYVPPNVGTQQPAGSWMPSGGQL